MPEFVEPSANQLQFSFVERAEPKHQQIIAFILRALAMF
jgi:hypothetical protein